jgi:hypothetical protein
MQFRIKKHLQGLFRIEKPHALPLGGWSEWETKTRQNAPFGYWLTETVPDFTTQYISPFFTWPGKVRRYIRNRWVYKMHYLKTGLTPGKYYDYDYRLLHGVMESMAEFVETEKSWTDEQWNGGADPAAALRVLDWEIGLGEESPYQSAAAKELKEIYLWWKNVRPNRPDPMDASGWSALCDSKDFMIRHASEEAHEETKAILDLCYKIEEEQNREDEEYLIRLMKIRSSLWT